ncbi:MAG: PD-(D/E)XK nuclease family transposase [Chthoniobacterales bacterium]|nr:PD-(D/E)XK nuclease family transposase [Chthoniobacterales bacterium]
MKSKKLIRFDWAIKNILRNKTNFEVLEGFLSELLRTDVKIESLLESESNQKNALDKLNRVDLLAGLASGEKVIIEVQCVRQWDFLSRMLYGVSKVVIEHLKTGEPYGKVPKVISVNIVYFDLGHGQDYIYHGTTEFRGIHQNDVLLLGKVEKERYPNHIDDIAGVYPEYYVLKVGEFDLKIKDTLDEWMYALKQSEIKSEFKAKGIQEAGRQLDILQLPEEERRHYENYLENMRDFQSFFETYYGDGLSQGLTEGLQRGVQKGREEGRQEGRAEGKREMILNLHHSGMPLDQIARLAKMEIKEVEAFF